MEESSVQIDILFVSMGMAVIMSSVWLVVIFFVCVRVSAVCWGVVVIVMVAVAFAFSVAVVVAAATSSDLTTWMIMNISLMQYFHLHKIEAKRYNGSDEHLQSIDFFWMKNSSNSCNK